MSFFADVVAPWALTLGIVLVLGLMIVGTTCAVGAVVTAPHDKHNPSVMTNERFIVTSYPQVILPGDTPDIVMEKIEDAQTGTSYLVVQSMHGLSTIKLDAPKAEAK